MENAERYFETKQGDLLEIISGILPQVDPPPAAPERAPEAPIDWDGAEEMFEKF